VDSDDRLLLAVASGDDAAVEELYDAFAKRVYGFGMRLLADPGLAEELVQETFVRIWREGKRFDPKKGNARTFIFTVARRIAIDLHRRPSSRPLQLHPEQPSSDKADDVATHVDVERAMNTLSDAHRQVLELLHFQQLTQTETASALGIPLGTVKTRAFHATRALRLALQGDSA
jgi:RNA polymerase sigma-70 factor, ECF subfamily